MEQYEKIQQLLKKEPGTKERVPIFPPTVIQAVFDAKTGASLEAILAQFNSIYVQYQGTPKDTRLIIPKEMRRAGLTITYMDMKSNTITERANSAIQKDNDHWALDVNWSRIDELSLSGDIAVSARGTWIINGADTGIKAVGPKGENGITPWLKEIDNKLHYSYDNVKWTPCSDPLSAQFRNHNNRIQISYDKGKTWKDISDPVATYVRFAATSSTGQDGSIGKLQYSHDKATWHDLSPEFRNYLRIQGYVPTHDKLPTGVPVGTIYGVGPTYKVDDITNSNPMYQIFVWNGTDWVNNGYFTSISAGIVQETGNSENAVMSQKAVTEKLSELASKVGLLYNIIDNNDICNIVGEFWNSDGTIVVSSEEYAPYHHRSNLIELKWFDNYLREGLNKKTGNGNITIFYFDDKKNLISETKSFDGGSYITKNAVYVAFNQYINTSLGVDREPLVFNNFSLKKINEDIRLVSFNGVTDVVDTNKIVKELYLENLEDNVNYGIYTIEKSTTTLAAYIYRIGEDGYTNEGLVAGFYERYTDERIFRLSPINKSNISGYIVINFDNIEETDKKSHFAKINKKNVISLDYNPLIKSHIESKNLLAYITPIKKWRSKVILIEDGTFLDVSSRWVTSKYDIKKVDRVYIECASDDNKSAIAAFYSEDGTFLQEYSIGAAGNHQEYKTYYVNVPDEASYMLSSSTANLEPKVSTVHLGEKVYKNEGKMDIISASTLQSVVYPTSPNIYMHHLFIDKIYTDSEVTIPSQSVFDVSVAAKLGFKMIEVNVLITSDGVPVTGHQARSGGYLQTLQDLNGNAVEICVPNITFDDLRTNYRYKSIFPQYRTPINSLEEFLYECRKYNLVPYVQCVNTDVISMTEKIFGYRYVAYDTSREKTKATISEYIGGTIDEIVKRCETVSAPYICAINSKTLNSLNDNELKNLVEKVHNTGCWIGWAGAYHSESQNQKFINFGFDFCGSGWNVPDFEFGDEVFVYGNSIKGFKDFEGDFVENKGIATFINGSHMAKFITQTSIISKGSLHICFKGELGITFGKYNSNFISDGLKEVVLTSIIENNSPNLYLYSYGDVEIYNISYKVSSVI